MFDVDLVSQRNKPIVCNNEITNMNQKVGNLTKHLNVTDNTNQLFLFKKHDEKLLSIVKYMEANVLNAVDKVKKSRPFSKELLISASKSVLKKKEIPVFRKIIYDIVSYTTTQSHRKIFGAMKLILKFLSDELNIPLLMNYIKVDNIQNALTHRYNKNKKNQPNNIILKCNIRTTFISMEQLNEELQYGNCILNFSDVFYKYITDDTASLVDIYENYKFIYTKMIEFLRPLFHEILKKSGYENNFFDNFLECFYKFEGFNNMERYKNLLKTFKLNINDILFYDIKKRLLLRKITDKFTVTVDEINAFENLNIVDALYNVMILQIMFKYSLYPQLKRYLDFLMICSGIPEKFVYNKGRTEYSRISKRLYNKLFEPTL
uniref:ENTH domain-containing protein n=1 Tax=Parastrongyloides trichosuri TaxID=131310 RepID=A0A0N4Z5P9_PARTI